MMSIIISVFKPTSTMAYQLQWALITALFLSAASLSTCASVDFAKIHEHMTEEELSATFNVKDRAAVPDYEIVPIVHQPNHPHRQRRSVPAGHHVVSIKNLTLYLETSDHVLLGEDTPVYLATGNKSHPHGIQYERIENVWPKNLNMYQDRKRNAAIVMYKESDGKVNVEGLIGDDTVVKPVPLRFKNSTSAHSHIVYRQKRSDTTLSPDKYLEKSYWSGNPLPNGPKSEVDTVYPEVLVIIDHETYVTFGKDIRVLGVYMAAFWNGVDLRFRTINNPKVRLNIAGMIVATDEDAAPYMTKHREGKLFLDAQGTLGEVGKYLYQEERFGKDTYDFAVAITAYDLCSFQKIGKISICNPTIGGLARANGACMRSENPNNNGVAVVEDYAGFGGVLAAAHEIGHLLGLQFHDIFGGICDNDYGFIMSAVAANSPNAYLWSDCSILLMTDFLSTKGQCLRNKPVVKRPIRKMLPGELLDRNDQCKYEDKNTVECEGNREDECRKLYCRKSGTDECESTVQPIEGSPCSGGGICLNGVCIHKNQEL